MDPQYYGDRLQSSASAYLFSGVTPPDLTAVAAVYADGSATTEGVAMGSYWHHAGQFTVSGFDLN